MTDELGARITAALEEHVDNTPFEITPAELRLFRDQVIEQCTDCLEGYYVEKNNMLMYAGTKRAQDTIRYCINRLKNMKQDETQ